MVAVDNWNKECLKCGGNPLSEPCYPIDGLEVRHYFSKMEFVESMIETLWKERLERLEYKSRSKSTPARVPVKKERRKGGISL